ncbi:pantoate--beta-alanine ligase [Algoriphagus sediminis]|uniref:Pantothenate synthetase n=1 Tax=Algoriphagus sediminis TaxID=3057113 RepID=A0ABT7YCK4_9BACT|nr:pantoate--beta-alanine ligase [Algoriphagus sediminis]MDN3204206.1 pantoate--beta-alanine ligase [Algoriphagus sediminis]
MQKLKVLKTPKEWAKLRLEILSGGQSIGFVPTMGALHVGHLELVKASLDQCDFTIVSIFINPTQFNNPKDFETYPKTLEKDLALLDENGVHAAFVPNTETMYPTSTEMTLSFGKLEKVLEGKQRPGHFSGVGLVVSKLFNIIKPQVAFFGQKDLQQIAVIKRLVADLSFQVDISVVPTKREADGLACSSRNVRLSPSERKIALVLFKSLSKAKSELLAGENWFAVRQAVESDFQNILSTELEYFELVHPESFALYSSFDPNQKSSLCVAANVGDVRLIDNLPVID